MTCLICGSLAYDTIMSFHGRFSDAILPDQLHKVNVAFLVPGMRREFGGTAGNIAYNLKLLGSEPRIMATIGVDGEPYLERLAELELSRRNVRTIKKAFTAQAFITTDIDGNQITAFHPGAMAMSHENKVAEAGEVKLAIVAPDGRDGMVQNAKDCAQQGIPFIFDPGQGLPMFNGDELLEFIDLATYVTVNDYEAELLVDRTGLMPREIAQRLSAFIITRGEMGAEIYTGDVVLDIPCVPAENIVDPTGCGDAFRAGLMHGIINDMDLLTCGRLGSLMGAIKISHQGGQNHKLVRAEIAERFKQAFGYEI
ncbi:MAG: carbohydrate kinase family protein [Burkholderiaceae bacterium]|nr:carbohydrate kinase family protein [Burkholderiaceae bacterium]